MLALILVVDGLTHRTTVALHQPLLIDYYPPQARVRVLSPLPRLRQRSATSSRRCSSPCSPGVLGFTWRGVFLVFGVDLPRRHPADCFRLRDPGFGRWDTQQLRGAGARTRTRPLAQRRRSARLLRDRAAAAAHPDGEALLVGFAVFGMLLIPFQTFLSFYLDEELGLGPGAARPVLRAARPPPASSALARLRPIAARRCSARTPALVVAGAAGSLGVGVALICLAVVIAVDSG